MAVEITGPHGPCRTSGNTLADKAVLPFPTISHKIIPFEGSFYGTDVILLHNIIIIIIANIIRLS